jgi:hypothetical protein
MADDDHEFNQVVGRLLKTIEEYEATLAQKKRLVNELCTEYGRPPRFADVEGNRARSLASLKRDQFYGKPLATAIREFLEMRGPSDRGGMGAASVNEIFAALSEGGFKFEVKNEANAKRGLRIALSKNTVTFHRIGESYGLLEWYPNARPPKPATKGAVDGPEEEEESDETAGLEVTDAAVAPLFQGGIRRRDQT